MIRDLVLQGGSPPKKSKNNNARCAIDLTGEDERSMMKEEVKHLRLSEYKFLYLEEHHIAVAEVSAKSNQEPVRALLAKLG